MDSAIKKLLKTRKTKKQLAAIVPYRLAQLVEEVREEIGESLEEEDLRTCYRSFIDYLCDLLDDIPGVVESSCDFEGGPGMSSTYQTYWVKNAKRVAKAVLKQIKEEAKIKEEAITALKEASEGLLYQSESDEPFATFEWKKAEGELTGPQVLKRLRKPAKTPVEEVPLKDFFEPLTSEQDWHGPAEKATVKKYKNLSKVVRKVLADAKVFRVGKTQVDVYVAGTTHEGDWAGLKTTAVET